MFILKGHISEIQGMCVHSVGLSCLVELMEVKVGVNDLFQSSFFFLELLVRIRTFNYWKRSGLLASKNLPAADLKFVRILEALLYYVLLN